MLFRLANWTVMSIAMFYAAEGVGILERGRYFPTLPRLEARASDPMAWLGAAQWGVAKLASAAGAEGLSFPQATQVRTSYHYQPEDGPTMREALRLGGYYGGS
jgi:hypothetical protein